MFPRSIAEEAARRRLVVDAIRDLGADRKARDLQMARSSDTWEAAVSWLRAHLRPWDAMSLFRRCIDGRGWPAEFHDGLGTVLRGDLLRAGFHERSFHILNLGNIWAELVEAAVKVPVSAQTGVRHDRETLDRASDEAFVTRDQWPAGERRERTRTPTYQDLTHYRSHKVVGALKIASISYDVLVAGREGRETDGTAVITPEDARYAPFRVGKAFVDKHLAGAWPSSGYYVVYEDGYASWSPVKAFEEGYTALDTVAASPPQPGQVHWVAQRSE